ncbi:MAG: hypothetical protein ACE5H9_18550 [Anaerolineae bacterium]
MLNKASRKGNRPPATKMKMIASASLLAIILSGLFFLPAVAELLHIRTNMSANATVTSGFPAIVVNPTDSGQPFGEWVAVAWTDGVSADSGHQGPVWLKYTTETSGIWREQQVATASSSPTNKSQDVALAPDPVTANKVHLVWAHASSQLLFEDIYYASCTLDASGTTTTCEQASDSNAPEANSSVNLESPDVAVDASGEPHLVWVKRLSGSNTQIRYRHRLANGSWESAIQTIDAGGEENLQPAIAYSQVGSTEYLHLVWADQTNNILRYTRLVKTGGSWGNWEPTQSLFTAGIYTEPGLPDVAAVGSEVYVAWDAKPTSGQPQEYVLLYDHSSTSGSSGNWDGPKCLTSNASAATGCQTGEIRESGFGGTPGDGTDAFDDRLRPRLFMEITTTLPITVPHIVWHEKVDLGGEAGKNFDVMYTFLTGSGWNAVANVTKDTKGSTLASVAPTMVVGQNSEKQFAYMEQTPVGVNVRWEVYYLGDDIPPATIYLPLVTKN